MISFLRFLPAFLVVTCAAWPAMSQTEKKNDVVITVKIDGREKDIETYFEEWGESFGRKIERMFEDSRIQFDLGEDRFEMELGNICLNLDDIAESIAMAVTKAVTNMTIELDNIDPVDIDRNKITFNNNDEDLGAMIEEIEQKYHSKVKNIDKMKIKIREDYVKIDLEATLENGKKVNKVKIFAHR